MEYELEALLLTGSCVDVSAKRRDQVCSCMASCALSDPSASVKDLGQHWGTQETWQPWCPARAAATPSCGHVLAACCFMRAEVLALF